MSTNNPGSNSEGNRPTGGNKGRSANPAPRPAGSAKPQGSTYRPAGSSSGARPGPVRTSGARAPQPQPQNNTALIVLGVVGALIIIAGIVWLFTRPSNPVAGATTGGGVAGGSVALVETDKGQFRIKLATDDPTVAGTVKNFQDKAYAGYFNGLTFHRVEDWVVQGGDPLGTGTGGGDIPGEYNAARSFVRGAVGMASTGAKSATVNDSQWFVTKTDATFLDGDYANFGQVSEGMDVVDKIAIGDKINRVSLEP